MADFHTQTTAKSKDEWLTPPSLLAALGPFDLDPCSPTDETRPWPTAARHISLPANGLRVPWEGRVWCNPPYGKHTFQWIAKLAAHGNGIGLIFARTETLGFHAEVWEKADGVFFFSGRLKFFHVDGTPGDEPNAPSCLVIYGQNNIEAVQNAIRRKMVRGRLVLLKQAPSLPDG